MKKIEYLCYLLVCLAGPFLFSLPPHFAMITTGAMFLILPFYAVYAAAKTKPCGAPDEANIHQQIFRIIQKCLLLLIPALGIGALIFGAG